jgi:putative ATP-dependent endonuclease of OLD family
LSVKQTTFIICNGFKNSEFEDCLDLNLYRQDVLDKLGVDLDCSKFKGNSKWSDRVGQVFRNQGKLWDNGVESHVKYLVADCVAKNPQNVLNPHKRNSIDALIQILENLIKS